MLIVAAAAGIRTVVYSPDWKCRRGSESPGCFNDRGEGLTNRRGLVQKGRQVGYLYLKSYE